MTTLAKIDTNGKAQDGIQLTEEVAYHGIPVLRLHVDDPIPTPRAPERYAVRVHPDLARYLLTFNHPQNRKHKPSAIAKYARDMTQGYWKFTPEPIVFSRSGVLEDGQNRLRAVELSGIPTWFTFDFGWPDDLIEQINRGSSRTNADAFSVNGFPNAAAIAAAVPIAAKYHSTVGSPLLWNARLLTPGESLVAYRENEGRWNLAGTWGLRAYNATKGLGPSTWAAAFYVIAEIAGTEQATAFFTEFCEQTNGDKDSPTRRLHNHYLRRKLNDTASNDRREPMENIIRAFNGWGGRRFTGFVRTGGAFVLSAVRVK